MTEFHVVAATSELEGSGQLRVQIDDEEILLVAYDGDYYAIAYYCSHEAFTLEGGQVADGCIVCPYHGAEFALADGSVQASPAWEPIRTYPVRIADGTIAIGLPGQ